MLVLVAVRRPSCIVLLLAFLAFFTTPSVQAAPRWAGIVPESGDQPCYDQAGAYHGVDPWLLYAIAHTESGHNPRAVNRANRNGTRDVGLMQINSIWLPTLKRYGIEEQHLFNACVSTYVGAWVLAKNIQTHGYSWQAIATYNVGSLNTPARRRIGEAYARKVYASYEKLVRERSPRR